MDIDSLFARGGLAGLVAFAVIAVWRGWLVPRSVVRELLSAHAEQLRLANARGDEWRVAAETAAARADENSRQLGIALEAGRTTTALMASMRYVVESKVNEPSS